MPYAGFLLTDRQIAGAGKPKDEDCVPADLLIFTVKFNNLDDAIRAAENHVGQDTIILSLLNGISSETIIGKNSINPQD